MSNIGKIVQVIGPVVDIRFEEGHLPKLNNAIEIDNAGSRLVVEVAQHMGDDVVRCVAMDSTDGLKRGQDCVDTGEPIKEEWSTCLASLSTVWKWIPRA